jgi:predicted nucleic acid-binding Zn ribbon protein
MMQERICAHKTCGQPFAVTRVNPDQQYCSVRCSVRARFGTEEKNRRRQCGVCGRTFVAFYASARYCDMACGGIASARKRRTRQKERTTA